MRRRGNGGRFAAADISGRDDQRRIIDSSMVVVVLGRVGRRRWIFFVHPSMIDPLDLILTRKTPVVGLPRLGEIVDYRSVLNHFLNFFGEE